MELSNNEACWRILDGLLELKKTSKVDTEAVMTDLLGILSECPEQNWIDAFSRYQVASKVWMLEELAALYEKRQLLGTVYSLGGWLGTHAYFADCLDIKYDKWVNIDLDSSVQWPAERLNNQALKDDWRFKSVVQNVYDLKYVDDQFPTGMKEVPVMPATASIVVNTACEHMDDYWVIGVPEGLRVVMQSNNMFGMDGHDNCKRSLAEFVTTCRLSEIEVAKTLRLGDKWERYMIIGIK